MDERAAEVADLDLEAAAMLEGVLAGTVEVPGPYIPQPRRQPKPPPPPDPNDPTAPDAATPEELAEVECLRPRTWGECVAEGWPRECPFLGCRHHLGMDLIGPGAPRIAFREVAEGAPCCALAVAEAGPHTYADISDLLAVTRSRCEQILVAALSKLRGAPAAAALSEDFEPEPVGFGEPW